LIGERRYTIGKGNGKSPFPLYSPTQLGENIMGTRSFIGYERKSGTVVGSYCHYDGYTTGVGAELLENFNSESAARRVANKGYFSSLNEESMSVEVKEKASVFSGVDSYSDMLESKDNMGVEFGYIWKNGEWFVTDLSGDWKFNTDRDYDNYYLKTTWESLDTAFVREGRKSIIRMRKLVEENRGSSIAEDYSNHADYMEERVSEVESVTIKRIVKSVLA